MNEVKLKGILKNIEHSHEINGTEFSKAELICKRESGQEDNINIKFKSFCNPYKNNDIIEIKGNLRSYSERISDTKNKVNIYVFTYFDRPEDEEEVNNSVTIDGRICKINELRINKQGKHNLHFILANNILSTKGKKRLNCYIPCIVWGQLAKDMSELKISDKVELKGQLHSREHKILNDKGEVEFRVAHELLVTEFKLI